MIETAREGLATFCGTGATRPSLLLAGLAMLAILIAGCGGGSSSGASAASETSSSSSEASSSASDFVAEAEEELAVDYQGRFTSPPKTAPSHKSGVNTWIISCGQANPGCAEPVAAAEKAATALGWKATVFDGNFGVGDAYNSGIRQAIAAGAEVIVTAAINCNQAKSGYEAAKAAGVIVVGILSFDCNDPKIHDGPPLFTAEMKFTPESPTAAELSLERGRAKAAWIVAHTDGNAKVINTDFAGLTTGLYQNEGFVNALEGCTTCEIQTTIEFTPEDLTNGNLKQKWASALAQYPEANAGVVLSDGIVIQAGLAQALQSAGRTKTFALISGEAYAPNAELIRDENGEAAAVPFDSEWAAWGAIDTALRVMAGKKSTFEGPGIQVVDKEHNLPAKGQGYRAPVNYEALYKKAWGVG